MRINYKHSKKTRLKISAATKGRLAWNKGKKCPWVGERKRKYFDEPKICLGCGKTMYRRIDELSTNWINKKYCSTKCVYDRNVGQSKKCGWCKNEFYPKYHRRGKNFTNKRFCSIQCVVKWREEQYKLGLAERIPSTHKFGSKEANINWKEGVTPVIEKIRKSKKYKRWRDKIYERDDWTCQECKKRGGDINVHHIKRLSELFEELNLTSYREATTNKDIWDMENGITLCIECHKKTF